MIILELGRNACLPGLEHDIPQEPPVSTGPVVPTNQGAEPPVARKVLGRVIVVVGDAPAASELLLAMIHHLRMVAVHARGVGRAVIMAVAGRRDTLDRAVLGKDDDVLPVVAVAARGPEVALKVVLVHVRAPAVVAAPARVRVHALQAGGLAAHVGQGRRVLGSVWESWVGLAVVVNGRGGVAAVLVVIGKRLVPGFILVRSSWKLPDDVARIKLNDLGGRCS